LQLSAVPSTAQANVAAAIMGRDQSCRLSNYRDCISCAHLCPRAELDWFTNNYMDRYSLRIRPSGIHIIDDVRNTFALRFDLHRDFDNRKFVLVPKKAESSPETVIVTHVLEPTHELGLLYHNTQLHPTPGIPQEFFLARFAWAIFPSVQPFLERGIPRLLIRVKTTAEGRRTVETERADAIVCRRLAGLPSRTPSPKKRRPTSEMSAGERDASPYGKRVRLDRCSSSSSVGSFLLDDEIYERDMLGNGYHDLKANQVGMEGENEAARSEEAWLPHERGRKRNR
jgi:HNH endonuclease